MRTVRRCVLAVFVCGIAGMIASSVAESTSGALTFGLLTVVAALVLISASAVASPGRADVEMQARLVEEHARGLIEDGAEEWAVRALVREAVRLGEAKQ